ncbi:unnamed protein product [Arctogadus glacialis]
MRASVRAEEGEYAERELAALGRRLKAVGNLPPSGAHLCRAACRFASWVLSRWRPAAAFPRPSAAHLALHGLIGFICYCLIPSEAFVPGVSAAPGNGAVDLCQMAASHQSWGPGDRTGEGVHRGRGETGQRSSGSSS